ncbi:MAG: hypothetical protein JXB32_05920 [Deltaproteobacteria bacterium]|nr:hypothetical protein [Deltaproteobacteria bacterium]
MRKVRAVVLSIAVAVLTVPGGGCNTPTLPIPPPIVQQPLVADPATGLVTIVIEDSIPERVTHALALNDSTQHGVVEARRVTGGFELQLPAEAGDYVYCYYMLQFTELSLGTTAILVH